MTRRALAALLCGATTAACVSVPVTAQPADLARRADELRARGAIRVPVTEGGEVTVRADDVVTVTEPGTEESHLWGLIKTGRPDVNHVLTVRNLVAGCGAGGASGEGCLADRVLGPIPVGARQTADGAKIGVPLFGLAGTVVGVVCLAICREPGGWAYVGTGLGVVVTLVPLATF